MSTKFTENNQTEELKKLLGKNLKYWRKKHRLSQVDLGYLAEIDHATISRYEAGKSMMYLPHLLNFCKILEIEPSTLLEGWEKVF